MKLTNILVVYTNPINKVQKLTLKVVKNALKKYKINHNLINRDKLSKIQFQNKNLVIAVGGDGTFLKSAHFIFDKTPLLGVNSEPKCKEGFFMDATKNDFEKKFRKILNGNCKIKKLHRLEAYINNKKVPELALNEYYVASEKPYHTACYYLKVRSINERQKSSGILISTAAGSYAWIKSAGGKTLPLDSDKFEYLVREPYCGKIAAKCNLAKGILNKNEKIEIVFEFGNGILIADSLSKEHKFKAGEKVRVKISKKPIHSIFFN